jgi:hypothetical protein
MGYDPHMASTTPTEIRAYLAGLKLANEYEVEELRKAPVELKLRQLWALMTSAHLLKPDSQREVRERNEVRRRWTLLYKAQGG